MAEELYVGIDVSKAELVVAMRPRNERMTLANDRAGIKRLVARLSEIKPTLVVVEATGGLQRQVVAALTGPPDRCRMAILLKDRLGWGRNQPRAGRVTSVRSV